MTIGGIKQHQDLIQILKLAQLPYGKGIATAQEVQQSSPHAAIQLNVLNEVVPLREQKMHRVFLRLKPRRFPWSIDEDAQEFLNTYWERDQTFVLVKSSVDFG